MVFKGIRRGVPDMASMPACLLPPMSPDLLIEVIELLVEVVQSC